MATAETTTTIPAPPGPDTPNYEAIDKELRDRGCGNWSSIPLIDPEQSPYRERLEETASQTGFFTLSRIVVARPERQWYTYTDLHQVSPNVAINPGPGNGTYGLDWEERASQTHSISVSASVSAGLFDIVDVSLTTTYGHSWTKEKAWGENIMVEILPGWMAWIDRATLINNLEGDFIWTGKTRIHNGSYIPLEGEAGRPFRWKGTSSGTAKRGSHGGILVTSQAPLSSTASQALESLDGQIKHDGQISLLQAPAVFLTNPGSTTRTVQS